jgi:hypothetical protein
LVVVTTTLAAPTTLGPVRQVIVVEFTTTGLTHVTPPIVTVAPVMKFVPVIVTGRLPAVEPGAFVVLSTMEVTVGALPGADRETGSGSSSTRLWSAIPSVSVGNAGCCASSLVPTKTIAAAMNQQDLSIGRTHRLFTPRGTVLAVLWSLGTGGANKRIA